MKPLEITFVKDKPRIYLVIFYEDGSSKKYPISNKPDGFDFGKHYSIADIYGYEVKPMRVEDESKKEDNK